jgi:hypothetical protein
MERNRYFYLEYIFTFLIFLPLIFLLPAELDSLRLFIFGGILIGAGVAYLSRDQVLTFRKFVTLVASLLILLGAAYFVLKSTFLYREVIIICVKALALLIVLNSFSSFTQGYLSSIQVFSILLFFCICALTKEYNRFFLILASVFVLGLLALAKVKFYILFDKSEKMKGRGPGMNIFFVIALAVVALLSWVLFMYIPLGKIKTLGYLKEEDVGTMEEEEKDKGSSVPDEELQRVLTKLTFKLTSTDEMHYAIAAIQDLMAKRDPHAYEVEKAERSVLRMINSPALGQGQEVKEDLDTSVGQYVKKKIAKSLSKVKSEMNKSVEEDNPGLWQRFAVLSSVNRVEYSNSFEAMDKYSQQCASAINNAAISEKSKEQLRQSARQMKEWKSYQMYSKKLALLNRKIGSMNELRKRDFGNLTQRISEMNAISESADVDKLIGQMRQQALPEDDKLLKEAEQILKLKKVMLVFKESDQLRKKLEESGQTLDKPPELEEALNAVEESRDWKEIVEKIEKLVESLSEDKSLQIPQEVKDILGSKLDSLIKESEDSLKKKIEEADLPDSGEELLRALEKMDTADKKDKVESAADEMEECLDKLQKQGSVNEETKKEMKEEKDKVEQLLSAKVELEHAGEEGMRTSGQAPLDYKEEVNKLLQDATLKTEQKEQIEKLMDKLANAQTVSQVEDILEAANRKIEEMAKKEDIKDLEKIKELMEQAAEIKKTLLQDATLKTEQKEQIEKLMDKLANAQTVSQVEDILEAANRKIEEMAKKEDIKDLEKIKELMEQAAEIKKTLLQDATLKTEQKEQIEKLMDKLANAQTVSQVEDILEAANRKIEEMAKKEDIKDLEKIKELMEQAAEIKKTLLQDATLKTEQKEQIEKLMDKLANAQTVSQVEDILEAANRKIEEMAKKEDIKDLEKIKELMEQAAEIKKTLLQDATLKTEQKEQIEKLMDKLANAQTVSQVEDILEAANRKIEEMAKKEDIKDLEKIKELMEQAAEIKKMFVLEKNNELLREKIDALKNALPQQAALLEKKLDQVRESKNKEELVKNTEELKKITETKQFEKQFKPNESVDVSKETDKQEQIKIDLLPGYVVMPVKSSASLKSVTTYDNFIKDVSPELEWFSSNPSVASVDQSGRVYAVATGETEITCRYRGTLSRKCKVTVVQMMSEEEARAVNSQVAR